MVNGTVISPVCHGWLVQRCVPRALGAVGRVNRGTAAILAVMMLLMVRGASLAGPPVTESARVAAHNQSALENAYYKIVSISVPDDIVLECGGMEVLPDGTLFVSTRRGDIYKIENAYDDPPTKVKFTKWATGLHEAMGLAYNQKDGYLYAIQRPEITRLKDTDGRGRANVYETYCDGWGLSGNGHEYPFMSKFDKNGNLFVVLCLTGSFTSDAPYRGWCMKITPDGKSHPYASGIRSPGGICLNHLDELFYTDNQGPWNGTSSLKQITEGSFQGHTAGLKWWDEALKENPGLGPKPPEPTSGSRIYIEAKKVPQLIPPVCLLPHELVGQSSSGIIEDCSGGKFGPFEHQMFVADQHHSNIARVALEKIGGRYQGVCIPFREGFSSGIVPMVQAPDGSLFVGGTNRGWGSVGPKVFALEHLVWTGKAAFEIFDMKVKPDGFEVRFTEPVEKSRATELKNYDLKSFTYIYRAEYGSPVVDETKHTIQSVTLSEDGKSVRLVVDGMKIGSIHELRLPNLRSAQGDKPLLHPVAYYTLWNIPER